MKPYCLWKEKWRKLTTIHADINSQILKDVDRLSDSMNVLTRYYWPFGECFIRSGASCSGNSRIGFFQFIKEKYTQTLIHMYWKTIADRLKDSGNVLTLVYLDLYGQVITTAGSFYPNSVLALFHNILDGQPHICSIIPFAPFFFPGIVANCVCAFFPAIPITNKIPISGMYAAVQCYGVSSLNCHRRVALQLHHWMKEKGIYGMIIFELHNVHERYRTYI